ncbi:Ran BP2/NZF zinc finger-like superfamily protein isoform 1 [Hibiscus syriacus]|uniref:Ran BP2/NZF zinc finger-like superfamily protein isoform 1 n=1 Tax=Hibiscus syriacus TaxID=106335 RepID=A0A6A3BSM3_HIBSY|nr:Ran BP2/NZF zinc finger-like superfamily protein isoform 1 [Hibiscus syriacus]
MVHVSWAPLDDMHLVMHAPLQYLSSIGAPNIRVPKLCFEKARVDNSNLKNDRIWLRQRPIRYASLVRRSEKAFSIGCGPTLGTQATTNLADDSEETKTSGLTSQLIPNSSGVESLVRTVCDTISVAEFELKLGGFRLYLVRDLAGKSEPPPAIANSPPVTVSTNKNVEAPVSNGPISTSLAITKPLSSSGRIESFLDKAADEGLVILQSPMVGFFRRSRTIKGKRTPPSCKEKQIVKEGQVLCYIEQLGGEIPIESDASGEVIKILREDGDSVGYGDALIAILPSFPGIMKLQ